MEKNYQISLKELKSGPYPAPCVKLSVFTHGVKLSWCQIVPGPFLTPSLRPSPTPHHHFHQHKFFVFYLLTIYKQYDNLGGKTFPPSKHIPSLLQTPYTKRLNENTHTTFTSDLKKVNSFTIK